MVGTWKRLATATADGSSKILSTGTITDLPHLRIECFGHVSSGNMDFFKEKNARGKIQFRIHVSRPFI